MNKKILTSFLLCSILLPAFEVTASKEVNAQTDSSDMFTSRDYEVGYNEDESAFIQLEGNSASCNSDAVEISGSTVTIIDEGTYILSGTLDDGMIIVNAGDSDKLQLVFDNVSIHSETSAPIYIKEADKVFITLAPDSSNTLSNGDTFTAIDDNNIDGCIFSKQDLTFNGTGSLSVTSPSGHGIVCKDDLVFTSGTYTISSASHGLEANDSIRIANASLTIDSGKDGLNADNSDDTSLGFIYVLSGDLHISAEDDGFHSSSFITIDGGTMDISSVDDAMHADDTLSVSSGTISISECYEGLEGLHVAISGGDITLTADDDGLNAAGGSDQSGFGGPRKNDKFRGGMDFGGKMNAAGGSTNPDGTIPGGGTDSEGSISISGGNIYITAYGDGIDANGSVEISGGCITVWGPATGDTSVLDYDTTGIITGGTFIGTGAYQMAQIFSDSEQGVVAVSINTQDSRTEIKLFDSDGNEILSSTPELPYALIILSSPELRKGESYTLTVGSASQDFTAN